MTESQSQSQEHLEEKAHEVVEHLQAAALELIEAARAMLDVAEDMVKDPADLRAWVNAAAARAGGPGTGGGRPENGEPGVQHIRVS